MPAWINDVNAAMLTDLYQLTMMQAYWIEGMHEPAVFDLFARRLPSQRNYLIAAGLDDLLHYLETLRFEADAIAYLRSLGRFRDDFLDWLSDFRFTGDVYAVPEGTAVFANEPIVEVVAPIAEAQLIESFAINQINLQTMLASKAARVVQAAQGRTVVDFGMRRAQGTDAAMKAARAAYIVGAQSTSNVLAGQVYGIPIAGTMAHSYVEAHDDERDAFRGFANLYGQTVLLVDTYDTLEGVRRVVQLAREMGDRFKVQAVRLDSGDLASLAKEARRILDEAGLQRVGLFASGGLDEYAVADLLDAGAPIDGFGVGTAMTISADAPSLDTAYKLVAYAGRGRMKLSTHKATLPGRKQIFRMNEGSADAHDVLALHDESLPGRALLVQVMHRGRRLPIANQTLDQIRARAMDEIAHLPARLRSLTAADPPYRVEVSPKLKREAESLRAQLLQAHLK